MKARTISIREFQRWVYRELKNTPLIITRYGKPQFKVTHISEEERQAYTPDVTLNNDIVKVL